MIEAPSSDVPDQHFLLPPSPIAYHSLYHNSLEPRSPDNVFKKANGILHGGSGALDSKLFSMPALENNNEADTSISIRNSREKRPALGHKHAQFSLRQPSAGLELDLNFDQLQDPVDFFSAYEKLQCNITVDAKDEIERQTCGNITSMYDYKPSANPRCRRPGILGKSVIYEHGYPSVVSEIDDSFSAFQEAMQEDNLCPSGFVSQQETANSVIALKGNELAESISKTENKINELLDELLSDRIENLEGDRVLSRMQESMQIKPADVGKCLPDFSGTGRTDIMDLEKGFSKNRKSHTNTPKLMRGLSGKTPVNSIYVAENQVHTLASPTTPKSPFAALSLLNKHISQSKPIIDPFMAFDIDLSSSARNASSLEDFNRPFDERKEFTISDKPKSPTEVEATRTTVTGTVPKNLIEGVTPNLLDKSVNVNSSSVRIGIRSTGSDDVVVHHYGDSNKTDSARADVDTNLYTNYANRMEENGQDILQETISYPRLSINIGESSRHRTSVVALRHGLCDMDNNVEDLHQDTGTFVQPNVNTDDPTTNNIIFSHSLSGLLDSSFTEGLIVNRQPIAADKDPEQHNKALKKGSAKDVRKARRIQEQKKRKAITRRQSLLETGTDWESGVRRSKRIRTRPLEYWKGERFLYGRVHESLATVIGIKCISPAEDRGEPTFRVSSYVSDKHKELVELAARH